MRYSIICLLCLFSPFFASAQLSIGVKAGLNFANVTNTAGINANSRTGYMIGGYISPKPKKILGFRSEIMLSRQGYDYKTNGNSATLDLDYLLLPQLITINFTKKVEIHVGMQLAFLLNGNADSTGGNNSLLDYFKRFDYGIAAGLQLSPISGLFVGARINVGLNNINDDQAIGTGTPPDYYPREFVKNNVVQIYAGWRF